MIRRPQPAVHVDHIHFGHVEVRGDLLDVLGTEVAVFEGPELAFDLAQIEEQLLLRRGSAHLHQ